MDEAIKQMQIQILKERYRTLSLLEEEFPPNSTHRVLLIIQNKMVHTINSINELKGK